MVKEKQLPCCDQSCDQSLFMEFGEKKFDTAVGKDLMVLLKWSNIFKFK